MTTISKGMAAPAANVAADVSAACTGRAVVTSEIPSSSRACAAQSILRHQLLRDLLRQLRLYAAFDVDVGKLLMLEPDILRELFALARQIGLLGVGLRAHRHIFAGRHRHGAGNEPGDSGNQDIARSRRCRSNADDQTCRRDNAVIGSEHGGSQPADALYQVTFGM